MRQLHRITGIIVSLFILLHLFNHSIAWFGVEMHQKTLDIFREFYRIPIIEVMLVVCFVFQAVSGIKLFVALRKKKDKTSYEKIQMYSGIALAYFIIQHIPATIGQRLLYEFDTNFYFAAKVVIQKPWLYYFVPYYFIGVMAVGLHIANVHKQRISPSVGLKVANVHFYTIVSLFAVIAFVILYTLMGGRFPVEIPTIYNM